MKDIQDAYIQNIRYECKKNIAHIIFVYIVIKKVFFDATNIRKR